jgi:hypothetical protein
MLVTSNNEIEGVVCLLLLLLCKSSVYGSCSLAFCMLKRILVECQKLELLVSESPKFSICYIVDGEIVFAFSVLLQHKYNQSDNDHCSAEHSLFCFGQRTTQTI